MVRGLKKSNILDDDRLVDPANVIRLASYRGRAANQMPPQWGIPEGERGIGGDEPRREDNKPGKLGLLDDPDRVAEIKAALPEAIANHASRASDEYSLIMALCQAIETATGAAPRFTHGAFWLYDCRLGYWIRTTPADRFYLYRLLHDEWDANGNKRFILSVNLLTKMDSLVGKVREISDPRGFEDELPGLILETNLEPHRADDAKAIKQALIWEPRADGKVHYHPPGPDHLKRFACWDPRLGIRQVVNVGERAPDCPKWDRYLDSIWKDDPDRQAKQECLEAFLGACLAGIATEFQVMLVFIGGGANGKSILMEFIQRHLFGPDQTCCLPPDEWRGFMKARLDGPLINLVPELDERSVFANAAFKSALAGEPMTTDVKNKASYEFRPRAGHVFAANQMPPATDHTVGFLRRFIMIGFNRSYLHDPTRREPREILADLAEIAPVVRARCIWACAAALKNRGYTVPEEHQTLIREWSIRSNTYKHFCESVLVEAPGMIEQSRMFKAYTEFCGAVGNRAGGSRKFYEELSLLGYQRSAPNQSKRRYFEGLGIKPREEWGDGSAQNDEWL